MEASCHSCICQSALVKAGAAHNWASLMRARHTASKPPWQGSSCSSQAREAQVPVLPCTDQCSWPVQTWCPPGSLPPVWKVMESLFARAQAATIKQVKPNSLQCFVETSTDM